MLERLIARVARALSRRTGLHVCRVVIRAPLGVRVISPGCDVRCETVGLPELLPACADPAMALSEHQARAALGRGDLCISAYVDDRLVGYLWIATGTTPHAAGLHVEIDRADCYFYKKFVDARYRGLRIGDALDAEADKVALRLRRNRVIGFIDLQNTAHWKALKRRAAWTAGYAGYFTCFGMCVPFRTRGVAQCGFSFVTSGSRSRPSHRSTWYPRRS